MTVCSEDGAQGVFTAGTIEVAAARLDVRPDVVGALSAWLCEAEQQRAAGFRFDRDRRRFIVARARLRQLLAVRLGLRPESVQFEYGSHGKPALAQRLAGTGLTFNVAHCEDLALYAFSRGCDIGVDVEAIRALREADDIAARFFSPRENDAYRALAAQERPLAFLRCWTRKEALVKALGAGLRAPLERLDVSQAPAGGWRLESFAPLPGFIAAVAASHQR